MRRAWFVALLASACGSNDTPARATSTPPPTPPSAPSTAPPPASATASAPPPAPSATPPRLAELATDFTSADWHAVGGARRALLALEAAALPVVGSLLDAPRLVPLQGTADLIYPGAERFYGHGVLVPFDLDWTHVRAGWLLESLVFESFGFEAGTVPDGRKRLAFGAMGDAPADFPKAAVAAAKAWLATHTSGWQRVEALRAALASSAPERQALALAWLRSPDAPVRGFSTSLYEAELASRVKVLADAGGQVGDIAKNLLREAADPFWRETVDERMREAPGP